MDFGLHDGVMSIGGSGWYRMALPARALARMGHEVWIGTLMQHPQTNELLVCPTDNREVAAGGFDVIVLQRWMNHDLPDAIARARANGQVIVNDLDDWFWGLDPRNRAHRSTDPKVNPKSNRDHYRHALARSSAVTVSTPFLADKARTMFPRAEVILLRNAIDLERWTARAEEPDPVSWRVLGWVGAIPWRSGDLESVKGIIGPWCRQNGWHFHHGGHMPAVTEQSAGEVLGVDEFSWHEFEPIERYPGLFSGLDVGIVPLTDIAFNQSKSAIKGLEYAASGVPFVASASAEYMWLRSEHSIGRTARRLADWRRELNKMLDESWRANERARNLEHVKAFDIAHRGADWAAAYAHLALVTA